MPSVKDIELAMLAYLDVHLSHEAKHKLKEGGLEWAVGEIVSHCANLTESKKLELKLVKGDEKSQHQGKYDFVGELESL